jgi:hypothetical protein
MSSRGLTAGPHHYIVMVGWFAPKADNPTIQVINCRPKDDSLFLRGLDDLLRGLLGNRLFNRGHVRRQTRNRLGHYILVQPAVLDQSPQTGGGHAQIEFAAKNLALEFKVLQVGLESAFGPAVGMRNIHTDFGFSACNLAKP